MATQKAWRAARPSVNRYRQILHRAGTDLAAMGLRWCIVGGFAVSARSWPRFTGDIDIAVAMDEAVILILEQTQLPT